jgi:hypothetical protein
MPIVKNKAASSKELRRTKKKTLRGVPIAGSVILRRKGFNSFSTKLAGRIAKLTAKLGKDLKGEILKIPPKSGRHVIGFNVIVDDNGIRIESPRIKGELADAEAGHAEFDPLEAGRKAVQKLQQAKGGAWTGSELELRFDLTPANLHKRRMEYRIVFWRDAKNQFFYPKWQFNAAGALLAGVQEVLQTFHSADEWRVMRYFLGPRTQLADRAPLDLLCAGEVEDVVAHAKIHAEENTW